MLLMKELTFLILFFMVACGGGSSGSDNAIEMETDLGLEAIINNQSLTCSPLSGSSCPEGIGRIFIQSGENPQAFVLCTGFLIGPNRFVTNGHCISRAMDCPRAFVTFPSTSGPVSAQCSRLIQTYYDEDNFPDSQDITILELDRNLSVRTLPVSSRDAQEGESYSVWVMDHFNILEARLTEYECQFEGDGFTEEYSNCPVIQGNSGSPIMDNQDNVVSIIWGSTLDRSVGASFDLGERRELDSFAFGYGLEVLR